MRASYVITSIFLALATGLFTFNGVRYLFPPSAGNDVLAVIAVTVVLSAFSLSPKPRWLNSINWLVVPLVTLGFIFLISYYEPRVADGVGWAIFFSIFSFGIPFIVYIAIVIANFIACAKTFKGSNVEKC